MAEMLLQHAELQKQMQVAEEQLQAKVQQLKSANAALSNRERSHDFIPKDSLYNAFALNTGGEQRSDLAAELAAQRAVQKITDPLPADVMQ